jgi:hypothetical protein
MSQYTERVRMTLPYTKENLALAAKIGQAMDPDVGGDKGFMRDVISYGDEFAKPPTQTVYADTISTDMPCPADRYIEIMDSVKDAVKLQAYVDKEVTERFADQKTEKLTKSAEASDFLAKMTIRSTKADPPKEDPVEGDPVKSETVVKE